MSLAATYLGANGWLLEFDAMRVLVDPWLKGDLSFPPGAWLLRGELGEERDVPPELDLLLLLKPGDSGSLQATTLVSPLPASMPAIVEAAWRGRGLQAS